MKTRRLIPALSEEQIVWFWTMVQFSLDGDFDKCWPWLGEVCWPRLDTRYTNKKITHLPYGRCGLPGGIQQAHRVAYFIFTGEQPGNLFVLHNCNNPVCCNPTHLRTGTQQDNIDDMVKAGRDNFWGYRNKEQGKT